MIVPIFSGGVGRSGTTLVAHLLKNSPDVFVAMPREVKFITEGYGLIDLCFGVRSFSKTQTTKRGQLITTLGKLDPISIRFLKFKKRMLNEWWYTSEYNPGGALDVSMPRVTMEKLIDELGSNLSNPIEASRNFVFSYIKNHKEYNGEKYWIDTSLTNIMYSNFIYQIFPETKFIEMRRHPLDNIAAVLNQHWGPNNFNFAVRWWSDRIKLADLSVSKIPSDKHLMLSLEDLVKDDRVNSYNKLCSFVGVSGNNNRMIDYFNSNVTIENASFNRWLIDFKDPIINKEYFNNFIKHSKYDYKISKYLI